MDKSLRPLAFPLSAQTAESARPDPKGAEPAPDSAPAPPAHDPVVAFGSGPKGRGSQPAMRPASGPAGSPVVGLLAAAALVWVASIAAMVVRGHGGGAWRTPEIAVGLVLAIVPAAFIVLFAYALQHLLRVAGDVRAARALSDDLVAPVALAASHAGGVVEAVRSEIDRAAGAASDALGRLNTLRGVLAEEGSRLVQAGADAERQTQGLGERLRSERLEIERLAADVGAQAGGLDAALAERARLFASASDAAAIQIRAAGEGLEGGVERLTIAAEAADRAAEAVAGRLTRECDRLGELGAALGATLAQFGGGLAQEREALTGMVEALRLEHEDAAALSESRTARLRAEVVDASAAADAVTEAAGFAVEALRASMAEAGERLRAVAELGRNERQRLAAETDAELDRLTDAAQVRRDALLKSARDALDSLNAVAAAAAIAAEGRLAVLRDDAGSVAEAARARVDELGEAAFEAGRRADQAFEARLAAAQRSVETVSATMEEASRRSMARIETGLAGPREAMRAFDGLLRELDARLPEDARARADEVRRAIDDGVEALAAAARRTAEETLAVDAAFQDRVRTNYASLSEAVRLMSAAAESSDSVERVRAATRMSAAERPNPPVTPTRAAPLERSEATRPVEPGVDIDLQRAGAGRRAIGGSTVFGATPTATPTLRPRLRLTPTREDEAAHALFDAPSADLAAPATEQAPPAPPASMVTPPPSANAVEPEAAPTREAGWSWKDLLSSVDEGAESDEDETAGRMASEIAALGLDADALLPSARTLEASRALSTGGLDGVRDTVRRIAPAAVRRLSRRVLTDRLLRTDAARFLREQQVAVQAAERAGGGALGALFGSDVGRTYLLLDAAVGDVD